MKKKEKKAKAEKPEKAGKKGKKKLLLIPIILVLAAAIAAAAVLFVLPKFGIDLLGRGDAEPDKVVEEKVPKKGVQTYEVGEDVVPSLDTVLEEGEGELLALRTTPEKSKAEEEGRRTYIYELEGAAAVMNRYLDLVLGGEEGFSIVDETYLIQDERPELEDTEGALLLAKNSVVEGRVFQLAIGWSEASDNLAVRVSTPEGQLHKPQKVDPPEPASLSEQMSRIQSMTPSQLALPGASMGEYDIYPIEGFVKIDGLDCRRFNIYVSRGPDGDHYPDLEAIVLLSSDQKHVYRLDPESNAVTELR